VQYLRGAPVVSVGKQAVDARPALMLTGSLAFLLRTVGKKSGRSVKKTSIRFRALIGIRSGLT
jgi:hypothetical protein